MHEKSPSNFNTSNSTANAWNVNGNGNVNNNNVPNGYGVRPAISLKSGTLIASGTGTLTNPYIIAP